MSESDDVKKAEIAKTTVEAGEAFQIEYKPAFEGLCLTWIKVAAPINIFTLMWIVMSAFFLWAHSIQPSMYIGLFLAVLFSLSYVFILLCMIKKQFMLRQWGISLPLLYGLSTNWRLRWSWSQLVGLVFSRSNDLLDTPDQVIIRFQNPDDSSQVEIALKINEVEQIDLKKLVYAIVTNAPHAVIEPPLEKVSLEFPTVSGIKHVNFSSFTNLWDEEFSTRYAPTLFVPLQSGQRLRNDTITIADLVACGGSAAIYSAKNSEGEQIIVKEAVIPKNASEALKTKAIELFNREALLLSKLEHPNIAKVFDHFVENEHHYEVLEYIDGLDLRRFVKERGPQPEDFVLNWAEQICEILVYLHSQTPPIIHRDLTPDNLVLRVDGQLVLIDFGAANAFVGTATGTMVGKQSYMPMEQLRGKSVPQSDIYSLGGTIYFLLTGRDPTPLEVSQIKSSDKLPMTLNSLLANCTALEVNDRYKSSEEMLTAIRKIREQRVVQAAAER
ncbi:MAG: serine/threonine protein kinase [Cyanobacteria bacterium SZAS-4]|nr:serine/threonine protein kinase [Cyanobacteria bacterium SZAS-4]